MEDKLEDVGLKKPARRKESVVRIISGDALRYFPRAIVLVALLTFAAKCSPFLPTVVLPVVFLLYALPATLGAMYGVFVRRLHNQYGYNKKSYFSNYNRSWTLRMAGTFSLALVSAFFFVLDAPAWGNDIWVLVWLSVPLYFLVLQIARAVARGQFARWCCKAKAIAWTSLLATFLLCVLYAFATAGFAFDPALDIQTALENRYVAFSNSPSALLCEADKLNSYSSCLTSYGLSQVAGYSFVIALIIKVILGAAVFYGFANQLGFCVLSRDEIKGEFKLLPVYDDDDEDEENEEDNFKPAYFFALLAVWVSLSFVFLAVNFLATATVPDEGKTYVDQALDEVSELIGVIEILPDVKPDDLKTFVDIVELREHYVQRCDEVAQDYEPTLEMLINEYYDGCLVAADSYLDWYEGLAGKFANIVRFVGDDMARSEFSERVMESQSTANLDRIYREYCNNLGILWNEYVAAYRKLVPDDPLALTFPEYELGSSCLELWPAWNDDSGSVVADIALLGGDSDELRDRVTSLIEASRGLALATLKATELSIWQAAAR